MDGSKAGRWLKTGLATAAMLVASGTASAQAEGDGSFFDGFLGGVDVSIGGFIRVENAFQTGDENPFNQTGNIYNGLWYPIIVALMSVVIGGLFLRETRGTD